jgi:hypothetical protein
MDRGSLGPRRSLRQIIAGALTLVVLPTTVSGQRAPARVIRGIVIDSMATPIAYSNISVDNRTRIVADDSGRFTIQMDSGRVVNLHVRRIGYRERSVSLMVVQDTTLSITLGRAAQALPAQQVTGENRVRSLDINGFYRRLAGRESGITAGYFITPEEIEQRRAYRATQMLEGVPGVRLARAGVFWVAQGLDRCLMSVYLDRIRLNSMGNRGAPVLIDDIVSSTSLAGIEIYTSAVKAPPEFQPLNGTCGVILLWTK